MRHPQHSLQSLFEQAFAEQSHDACWQPAVDIYQTSNAWLVKFDLAGVRPEDIEVVLDARRLIVRGVRRDWTILDGQQAYSMEISYNRFERVVQLPMDVASARFASEYRDGMFLVRITPAANAHHDR